MGASQRRQRIQQALLCSNQPISAAALARELGVSRQVIVGDVALLRAEGAGILATPRGYIWEAAPAAQVRTVACCHTADDMEAELCAMVDNGCTVLDVIVEHPIYGQLTGPLQLSSRFDVGEFIRRSREARPLSLLTDGIHLHTLSCPDEAAYERTLQALRALGILLEE